MLGITTKLEINITPKEATATPNHVLDFVKRYNCSLIVDPRLFSTYFLAKIKRGMNNKLGIILDFPKGETVGINKFTNLPEEIVDAETFDIILNSKSISSDLKKDLANTINTIKNMINPNAEIRLTLRRNDPNLENTLKVISEFPLSMVRDSQYLTSAVDHESLIKQIRMHSGLPIKLSGNITYDVIQSTYKMLGRKGKYDVSFEQAKKIVQSIEDADNNDFKQSRLATNEEINSLLNTHKKILYELVGAGQDSPMYCEDDNLIVESRQNLDNEILVELDKEMIYVNVKTKKPQKVD